MTRSLGGKTERCQELVVVAVRDRGRSGDERQPPRRSAVPPAGAADSQVSHQRRPGGFFPSHPPTPDFCIVIIPEIPDQNFLFSTHYGI